MLFDNLFQKKDKKILELIPIKEYREKFFILKDESLMDFMQIKTKNLASAKEDEVEYDILKFARLYKTYDDSLKIIGLNFPTDTKKQQQYLRHKINNTESPEHILFLEHKLNELEWLEKNRTDREYYLMFFAPDELKFRDNRNIIQNSLKDLVEIIPLEKKLQVLFKINNKNTAIFM